MKNSALKYFFSLQVLFFHLCYANDGAFRAEGNQLIPMYETDISVKKEILTIKRIAGNKATITVYYEFFNPKSAKDVEVGFEAASPAGDVDTHPVNGRHPYITGFTVNMNDQSLAFKVAIVSDSAYYKNGIFKSKSVAWAMKQSDENENEAEFYYVYHFRANFKQGLNIIKHSYTIELSNSVYENYDLIYILTAAKRWANRQIDDFTLQINMGEFQDLSISNTFFSKISDWQLPENTNFVLLKKDKKAKNETDTAEFFIRKGTLTFQAENFRPRGELELYSFNMYYQRDRVDSDDNRYDGRFDSRRDHLPFSIEDQDAIGQPTNDLSRKILKNLPFARRGYIFKSPDVLSFFERQPWYQKDPNYQPALNDLTPKEQAWVSKW